MSHVLAQVNDELQHAFDLARRVVVLTGAGISAESGVPTFRGGGGTEIWMWRGKPITELSSTEMLAADPQLLWEWFDHRRSLLATVKPNSAHLVLAEWERHFDGFTIITQNIDALHQAAGSLKVLELHGNIWRARCRRCGSTFESRELHMGQAPKCIACGGPSRPDVVLFGEFLPEGVFERAEAAARNCDLFFAVGTSAVVYPAASLPIAARRAGARIIEVNPELTDMSVLADVTLLGKAGEILPQFLRDHG